MPPADARRAMRAARRVCAALWLLLSCPLLALSAPHGDFSATYRLTGDGDEIGRLTQALRTMDGGRLRFTSVLDPAGLLMALVSGTIREEVLLERVAGRLRPLRYSYQRSGLGKNREVAIRFDWVNGVARNEVNGDGWSMAVAPGTLDKLGLLLAVVEDLDAGTLAASYPVADGGRIKHYAHDDLGEERITVPHGSYPARHLRRTREGKPRGTDFWHVPHLGHLPAAVERRDRDGRRLRLELVAIEPAPAGLPR